MAVHSIKMQYRSSEECKFMSREAYHGDAHAKVLIGGEPEMKTVAGWIVSYWALLMRNIRAEILWCSQ